MNHDERHRHRLGAPDVDLVAELLRERHPIECTDTLRVAQEEEGHALCVSFVSGRHHYEIAVRYERGAGRRDPWMLVADALDALFGTLIESAKDYRSLPAGRDVEFQGATFEVRVAHSLPELAEVADAILGPGKGDV